MDAQSMRATGGPTAPRVAVYGAGVIGQVYAGRLAAGGCAVWLLARGATFAELARHGLRLQRRESSERPQVALVDAVADLPPVDLALLCVRADQVDAALPELRRMDAPLIVTLVNLADRAGSVADAIGRERVVLGFPGVGGVRTAAGVGYHQIRRQPTTIGRAEGLEATLLRCLRAASLPVAVVPDMRAWLATHTLFIAGTGAAILAAGGSEAVGRDRRRTAAMVASIGEGFGVLARSGTRITPLALDLIFRRVPRFASVRYWQRQMCGEVGQVALAPHLLATRETEFPQLAAAARRLAPTAAGLDAALSAAGFPR